MSRKIYANLAARGWVNLTDADDTFIGHDYKDVNMWYSKGGLLDSLKRSNLPGELENYPFVNLHCEGVDYRVSPFSLQVVNTAD